MNCICWYAYMCIENAKLWLSKQNKNIYNRSYIGLETFFGLNSVVFTEIKKIGITVSITQR